MATLVLAVCLLLIGSGYAQAHSILDQVKSSSHTGFSQLLELANLPEELIKSDDGVTVFAPSDDSLMYKTSPALLAFLKLPANVNILRKVMLYHLVPARISAFKWSGEVTTFQGSSIALSMNSLSFFVGSIPLKQYSTLSNEDGVIHSISGLLIPPELEDYLSNIQEMVDDVDESGRRVLVTLAESPLGAPPVPAPAPSPEAETPPPAPAPAAPAPVSSVPPAPRSGSGVIVNTAVVLFSSMMALCLLL